MSQQKQNHSVVEFLPTAIYSQPFLIETLGLARATMVKWHNRGLKRLPTETKTIWYLGADIIRFFSGLSDSDRADDDQRPKRKRNRVLTRNGGAE